MNSLSWDVKWPREEFPGGSDTPKIAVATGPITIRHIPIINATFHAELLYRGLIMSYGRYDLLLTLPAMIKPVLPAHPGNRGSKPSFDTQGRKRV